MLRGLAGMTGYPIATGLREAIDLWNNTVGTFVPGKKIKTYDAGSKSNIKYATVDGYLTEEEAAQKLIETGEYDDADKAAKQAGKWGAQNATAQTRYTVDNWEKAFDDSSTDSTTLDNLVTAYAGEYIAGPYGAIRDSGYSPQQAMGMIYSMDVNANKSVTQEEVYDYLASTMDAEEAARIWDGIAKAKGWQSGGVTRSYAYAASKFG